jgi:hypothetical protein
VAEVGLTSRPTPARSAARASARWVALEGRQDRGFGYRRCREVVVEVSLPDRPTGSRGAFSAGTSLNDRRAFGAPKLALLVRSATARHRQQRFRRPMGPYVCCRPRQERGATHSRSGGRLHGHSRRCAVCAHGRLNDRWGRVEACGGSAGRLTGSDASGVSTVSPWRQVDAAADAVAAVVARPASESRLDVQSSRPERCCTERGAVTKGNDAGVWHAPARCPGRRAARSVLLHAFDGLPRMSAGLTRSYGRY